MDLRQLSIIHMQAREYTLGFKSFLKFNTERIVEVIYQVGKIWNLPT